MTQRNPPPELTISDDAEQLPTVEVGPNFYRRDYAAVCELLQVAPCSKVFDLRRASVIGSDLFETLVAGWHAAPGSVPRLCVVTTFDIWAVFRDLAASQLSRLAAFGVSAALLYDEQADERALRAWLSRGEIAHNVTAVLRSLRTRWRPHATWPAVLDAVSMLLREHVDTRGNTARLYTEAAVIASSCGGLDEAVEFAREAMKRFEIGTSVPRCTALRILGGSLMRQGQASVGLLLLEEAIAMAEAVGAPEQGAKALCDAGLYALNREDFPRAEAKFRSAIELIAPDLPDLLATLHHNLALALRGRDRAAAERHATTALALRTDPSSDLAQEDRDLLEQLRAPREPRRRRGLLGL